MSDIRILDGNMPETGATVTGTPRKSGLKHILDLDKSEPLIELAQTVRGRAFIFLVFTGGLLLSGIKSWQTSILIAVIATIYAYVPRLRSAIVAIATLNVIGLLFGYPLDGVKAVMVQERVSPLAATTIMRGALVAYTTMVWIALHITRRNKGLLIARRPVVALLLISAGLCGLTCLPVIHGIARVLLWSLLTVVTTNIWFLCYGLVDQRARDPMAPLFRLGIFHPFSGTSSVPWGKGAAFLNKTLAKNPRDLAITQLKAIKLLFWAIVLLDIEKLIFFVSVAWLHIPELAKVEAAYFGHHVAPAWIGWASLILDTVIAALSLTVSGHQAIAVGRLAGFRLPRNTYRLLEARSLAEYWNRYFYYFKELLVEFFFLPTFLRTFRNYPRLRVFFATFMAAGVGNAIYHFVRRIGFVASEGLVNATVNFTSYIFYCVVLATAIAISQVRSTAGVQLPTSRLGRFSAFAWIWTFVVCVHIFGDESRTYTLSERLQFMANLMGVY